MKKGLIHVTGLMLVWGSGAYYEQLGWWWLIPFTIGNLIILFNAERNNKCLK